MLPRHKVDSSVLEQGGEHEEQAHRHPNVNGFDVGHLGGVGEEHTAVRAEESEMLTVVGWNPPVPHCCPLPSWGISGEGTQENRRRMHQEGRTE